MHLSYTQSSAFSMCDWATITSSEFVLESRSEATVYSYFEETMIYGGLEVK